jgi:hypothetical protein
MQTATVSARSARTTLRLALGARRVFRPGSSLGLALCLGLAQGWLSPALAAGTTANAAFMSCAGEQDDARRLACFDAAVAQVRAQPAPAVESAAPAAAAATAAAVVPLSKEERFGLRGDLKQEKAKQAPELAELQELRATVTKVAAKPHGELVLSLDNGQVWYEIQANSGIRVKTGDQVTIRSGALGSYSVVAPNGRSSKVTRVR